MATKKRPRISVQDIAEILVQRIENVDRSAQRIEEATSKPLKINLEELKTLVSQVISMQNKTIEENKRILSHLKALKSKDSTRVPKSVVIALIVAFLVFLGVFIYFYKQHKNYNYLKAEKEYYQQEVKKLLEKK